MANNFRIKISEICPLTIIRRLDIPKRIGISQFWFQKVQWQLFLYIVYEFGEIRNPLSVSSLATFGWWRHC